MYRFCVTAHSGRFIFASNYQRLHSVYIDHPFCFSQIYEKGKLSFPYLFTFYYHCNGKASNRFLLGTLPHLGIPTRSPGF